MMLLIVPRTLQVQARIIGRELRVGACNRAAVGHFLGYCSLLQSRAREAQILAAVGRCGGRGALSMKANGNHHAVRRTADKLGRDVWGVGVCALRLTAVCKERACLCVSHNTFGPGCTSSPAGSSRGAERAASPSRQPLSSATASVFWQTSDAPRQAVAALRRDQQILSLPSETPSACRPPAGRSIYHTKPHCGSHGCVARWAEAHCFSQQLCEACVLSHSAALLLQLFRHTVAMGLRQPGWLT